MEREEAIRRIRAWNLDPDDIDVLSVVIPELRVSEDERIKRELIAMVEEDWPGRDDVLAWIEKHSKQKSEVKYVYTKFRIGDVIVGIKPNGDCPPVRVKYVGEWAYSCESDDGKSSLSFPIINQDEYKLVEQKSTDEIGNYDHRKVLDSLMSAEIKTPEESLGIDSDTYNKIVDECMFGGNEPKFKVGDWIITNKNHIWYVDETPETTSYLYRLIYQYGKVEVAEFEIVDKEARLWTIQDAKDGDVLYCESGGIEYIVMSKGINKNGNIDSYFRYNSLNGFGVDMPSVLSARQDDITPATKEQRDLLFTKMKEAGYEWDAENKKLYKLKDVFIAEPFGERHVQEKKIVEPKQENIQDFKVLERNGKDELTEFEVAVRQLMEVVSVYGDSEMVDEDDVKSRADWLLSIARKQIVSEIDNEDIQKTAAMYTGYEQSVFFSGAESVLKTIKGE